MSNSIDNPTVKMTFDNAQFEKNTAQTMSSIEKLKQSLNFSKGKDSMAELSAAAGKVNMGPIGTQIEGINAKFLALSTVAITALSGIASKALEVGGTLAKSLTIGPLTEGFQEYETNMNSIQTILANTKSKGSNLDDVEAALQNLNEYSDKTIYNFGEMAKNIGTFTAAGVDLDSSTNAIKGIANLAAISGSSSEQASSAMYQLSQALAAGKVGLVDWNSVVNAGMGGEVFKSSLFETAKAMGTIADVPMDQSFTEWEDAGNSFRDSLQDGWITADVLSNTLQGFTGDLNDEQLRAIGYNDEQIKQVKELGVLGVESATKVKTFSQLISTVKESIGTGWSDSFKIVVGDFEEARGLFTNINSYLGKYISGSAEARNNLLGAWKGVGGREVLLEGFTKGLAALESVIKPIKDAFRELFPPQTAEGLINLTMRFRDFMNSLILNKEQMRKVREIFIGVFSVFKIGVEIVKGIFSVFRTLGSVLFSIISSFYGAASGGSSFIYKLQEMLVAGGGIRKVFNVINTAIVRFGEFILAAEGKVVSFIRGLKDGADKSKGFQDVLDSLRRFFDKLKESGGSVKKVFDSIKNAITDFFNAVKEKLGGAGDAAGAGLSGFIDRLSDSVSPESFEKVFTILGTSLLGGIAILLGKLAKDGIKFNVFGDLVDSATKAFDQLGGALKAFQQNQRSDLLMKIAIAVGVLTVSLLVLSMIDPAKLGKALGALAVGMGVLMGVLFLFTKITVKPFQFASLASSMIMIALAALVLAAAVKVFSTMSWSELLRGVVGLAAAMLVLAGAAAIMSKVNGSFIRAGVSLIVLSAALWVFSKVIKTFAAIPFDVVKDGLLRIGIALLLFAGFTRLVDDKGIIRVALGIIGLSVALAIMAAVVERFGAMKIEELRQGLISIGLLLAGFAIFLAVMPDGASTIAKAAGLLIMAGALYVMAEAVKTLGSLKFGDLAKGIGAIALLLLGLVVAANALNGSLMGAVAIVVMAGALYIMAGVLEKIGNLGLETVLVGLLGLAGVLLILGAAAAALAAFPPLLAALTAMATALVLIGAGFALLGAGVYLAAKGLEIFVELGDKAGEAILSMLRALATAIPEIAAATAGGFIKFVTTIAEQAEPLLDAIGDIIGKLIDKLVELVPKLGELINALFTATLDIIEEQVPRMIEIGILLLTSLLTGIRDNIGLITTLGVEILTNFLDALTNNVEKIGTSVTAFITTLITEIGKNAQTIIDAGTAALVAFLSGLGGNIDKIITAVATLIEDFITAVGKAAGRIVDAGVMTLLAFLWGLTDNFDLITTEVGKMFDQILMALWVLIWGDGNGNQGIINSAVEFVKKFLENLIDTGLNFAMYMGKLLLELMDGLTVAIRLYSPLFREKARELGWAIISGMTGGLSDKARDVYNKIEEIAGNVIDKAFGIFKSDSPSKVFRDLGGYAVDGLALGLGAGTPAVNASKNLAAATVSAFGEALSGIKYDLEAMSEFNPVITPVLDLTRVGKDAKNLSGMLGSSPITANLSSAQASYLASAQRKTSDITPAAANAGGVTQIKFEQTINSPTALTANDVYRNTKSQLAMAKEELKL